LVAARPGSLLVEHFAERFGKDPMSVIRELLVGRSLPSDAEPDA
jgi:hypothetical protein